MECNFQATGICTCYNSGIRLVKESSERGLKNSKPERYDLVPSESMDEVARVYDHGAKKYSGQNWRKGIPFGETISALERHISLYKQGEDLDQESNLHHLAHAAFHCLELIAFSKRPDLYAKFDDRWKAPTCSS